MKISYLFPSKSRPDKFRKCLMNILHSSFSMDYEIICVIDDDDKSLKNYLAIIEWFASIKEFKFKVVQGLTENKIDACNKGISQIDPKSEIVSLMSDDMVFTKKSFDNDIREAFADGFRGLVHFSDGRVEREPQKKHAINFKLWIMTNTFEPQSNGDWTNGRRTYNGLGKLYDAYFLEQKQYLVTFPIIHKSYLDLDGWIYHPKFKSVCSDNFQTMLAKKRGLYRYVDKDIMVHEHHRNGFGEPDDLMKHNDSEEMYLHDREILNELIKEYGL